MPARTAASAHRRSSARGAEFTLSSGPRVVIRAANSSPPGFAAANRVPRAAFGELGARLAELHAHLPRVRRVAVDEIGATALRNVDELEAMSQADRQALASLRAWTRRQIARLDPVFARRAAAGAYRECHGDLHLQNLVWRNDKIVAFDALEFDRKLRDIDVISEIAFLAMDLLAHGRADLAY